MCMYVCMYVQLQNLERHDWPMTVSTDVGLCTLQRGVSSMYIYVYVYVYVYVCMYVCMYVYTYVYVCMYVCVYVYLYVCTYVCMYVCMHHMYIHIYTQTYTYTYTYIRNSEKSVYRDLTAQTYEDTDCFRSFCLGRLGCAST